MVRRPPTRSTIAIVIGLLVAFVVWTWLTFSWPPLAALDQRWLAPTIDIASPTAQLVSAWALLTWPGLVYVALAGLALWAYRHRLRQLAIALILIIPLGWGASALLKVSLQRERPEQGLDLLTSTGYAYPSGHTVAIVASTIAVGATFAVTRQTAPRRLLWGLAGGALVIAVGVDRWLSGAHYVSDVVGGALLGAFVASLALILAGVKVPVPHELVTDLVRKAPPAVPRAMQKRCAVIVNPARVTDWTTFRRHVEYEVKTRGWQRPLWLETTEEDPGRAMAQRAIEEGVDLVLGAGGDGTIRVVCSALAGTGIPFGLIPAGTGNLLAKNLGIPLDEAAALNVAFDGLDKPIDLVKVTFDDQASDHFAVMAGIGLDAVIMQGTNPDLKKAVGSAAYFLSAAQNAKHPALNTTIEVDDGAPMKRRAHLIVIGNVGYLQANIQLIPDAKADDGLLDVVIASPRGIRDWVRLTTRVLIRQRRLDDQLDRLTGQRVKITVDRPDQYQMDGDTVGECTSLLAEVQPGALLLRVPRLRREITAGPSAVTGDPSTNGASPPGTAPLAEAAPAEAVPTSGVPR
ncbi:MAG TPA: diacylglycerol kinase family protein [Propionibacteriaceae bacterium]|nr:diacylglycerol kinase family protein [Propionibacteriaceae bacterium]